MEIKTFSDWFDHELDVKRVKWNLEKQLVVLENSEFPFQKRKPLKHLRKYINSFNPEKSKSSASFNKSCFESNFIPRLFSTMNFNPQDLALYLPVFEGSCLISARCSVQLGKHVDRLVDVLVDVFLFTRSRSVSEQELGEGLLLSGLDLLQVLLNNFMNIFIFLSGTGPQKLVSFVKNRSLKIAVRAKCIETLILVVKIVRSREDNMGLLQAFDNGMKMMGGEKKKKFLDFAVAMEFLPDNRDVLKKFVTEVFQGSIKRKVKISKKPRTEAKENTE